MSSRVVIALGGNAISDSSGAADYTIQLEAIERACDVIVALRQSGCEIAITHGNGPQVGELLYQQDLTAKETASQPLPACVAMTQGYLGWMFQCALGSRLARVRDFAAVVTIITQVEVAFSELSDVRPEKPVGRRYTQCEAKELTERYGYTMKNVISNGSSQWRRIVPSPDPLRVVEAPVIASILEMNGIPIACGGGGVPVTRKNTGEMIPVQAVVDKDAVSALLANSVGADHLLILTDVSNVCLDYGRATQRALRTVSADEMAEYIKNGNFEHGSMQPKVEAALRFVRNGGSVATIASVEEATDAVAGKAGTHIVP